MWHRMHMCLCVCACGYILPHVDLHCVTVCVPVMGVSGAPSGLCIQNSAGIKKREKTTLVTNVLGDHK